MAETTEAVPANAPWLQKWDTVAKASGEYTAPAKAQEGPVAAVKRVVKPWLMEWGLIAKESPVAPSKPSVPLTPSRVDVSTEAKMKKAVYIAPHEVMPDTQSDSSNVAEIQMEIDREMKKKDPSKTILNILNEEKNKYAKKG